LGIFGEWSWDFCYGVAFWVGCLGIGIAWYFGYQGGREYCMDGVTLSDKADIFVKFKFLESESSASSKSE
jgi:hypothetical protein